MSKGWLNHWESYIEIKYLKVQQQQNKTNINRDFSLWKWEKKLKEDFCVVIVVHFFLSRHCNYVYVLRFTFEDRLKKRERERRENYPLDVCTYLWWVYTLNRVDSSEKVSQLIVRLFFFLFSKIFNN